MNDDDDGDGGDGDGGDDGDGAGQPAGLLAVWLAGLQLRPQTPDIGPQTGTSDLRPQTSDIRRWVGTAQRRIHRRACGITWRRRTCLSLRWMEPSGKHPSANGTMTEIPSSMTDGVRELTQPSIEQYSADTASRLAAENIGLVQQPSGV